MMGKANSGSATSAPSIEPHRHRKHCEGQIPAEVHPARRRHILRTTQCDGTNQNVGLANSPDTRRQPTQQKGNKPKGQVRWLPLHQHRINTGQGVCQHPGRACVDHASDAQSDHPEQHHKGLGNIGPNGRSQPAGKGIQQYRQGTNPYPQPDRPMKHRFQGFTASLKLGRSVYGQEHQGDQRRDHPQRARFHGRIQRGQCRDRIDWMVLRVGPQTLVKPMPNQPVADQPTQGQPVGRHPGDPGVPHQPNEHIPGVVGRH